MLSKQWHLGNTCLRLVLAVINLLFPSDLKLLLVHNRTYARGNLG
jgi:hypothetical protein